MVDLSIIIPCFNNLNFTKNIINDLVKLPDSCEIIITDNASTDGTVEYLKELISNSLEHKIKLIENGSNLGFGKANNQGYEIASGETILFLNNDVRVKSDYSSWHERLLEHVSDDSLISLNGGLLDSNFNFITETRQYVDNSGFYLSGWSLAGKKKIFDCLTHENWGGPWDSDTFFSYFEDCDLSFRAKEKGIPLKVVELPLHHFGRMTGKKLNLPKLYSESRVKFIKKWKK